MGEVLFYEDVPALVDVVFIRPQWLVDVMKELVRHDLPELVAQLADTADSMLLPGPASGADALRLQASTALLLRQQRLQLEQPRGKIWRSQRSAGCTTSAPMCRRAWWRRC